MRIGVIGSGMVGQILANAFKAQGYEVTLGTRDPAAKQDMGQTVPDIAVKTMAEAAADGEVIVFCVHGSAVESAAKQAGAHRLAGKLVLDTTNPLEPGPHGIHKPASLQDSLLERLQEAAPEAKVVKAWNCVPGGMMVDPDLPGGPGTQFICGNDEGAKKQAAEILADFGWDSIDLGDASMARYIEAMAVAVINHGARSGRWDWGLKLLSR